jgi:AcrR family transcriptional regulator
VATADTRARILDASLACFSEDGYERTTIARIRERSGTSNGAVFHHFASKEAVADALYVGAIASFQEGLWDLVRRRPATLREAVRGAIIHQLRWTERNADLARFVYQRGHLDWDSPGGMELAALDRDLSAGWPDSCDRHCWPPPLDLRCRLTLELVSDDGAVVARGEATARLS